MDRRERAARTLMLEEPDRVPLFELGINPPITERIIGRTPVYLNHPVQLDMRVKGKKDEFIGKKIIQDAIDLYYKGLKFDIFPVWAMSPPSHKVRSIGENLWEIGSRSGAIHLGSVIHRYMPETGVLMPDTTRLEQMSPEKYEELLDNQWSTFMELTEKDMEWDPTERIVKAVGDEMFIVAGIGTVGSLHTWRLKHFLTWLHTHPHLVERSIQLDAYYAIETAKAKIDMGADAVMVDCDWAYRSGPFMSPEMFRHYWLEPLKKVVDAVHRKGSLIIHHSDGNINLLLNDIVQTGIDGYQSIEPSAGMDIRNVKDRFGDRISLWGNIDLSYILPFGTIGEVIAATEKCILAAAPGGGHVMCSANSIGNGVKFENYVALIEATRKYGKYPTSNFLNTCTLPKYRCANGEPLKNS